jgi:hypothetical protein
MGKFPAINECYGMLWSPLVILSTRLTFFQWLHYLTQKLLCSKHLRVPKTSVERPAIATNTFSEVECYNALVHLEVLLAKSISTTQKPFGKKGSKKGSTVGNVSQAPPTSCFSAQGVVEYGIGQGWIANI